MIPRAEATTTASTVAVCNLYRWYSPGTGSYTRPDPLGLLNLSTFSPRTAFGSGIEMLYGYAEMSPLLRVDSLGLKSRVCCRRIPGVGIFGFRHCFIQTEVDGQSTTCGLVGGVFSGLGSNEGQVFRDNGFDRVKKPDKAWGPWNEGCGVDECVMETARNYPNPSFYQLKKGPNSNTFAGTIARKCGLQRPDVGRTPGLDDAPAGPKPNASPIPVQCRLP